MTSLSSVDFDPATSRKTLYAVILGMMATGFPFTILTVALQPIAADFGVSEALVAWTVSAPMLISAATLPLFGKLGDMYGHRRVFLGGLLGSTVFAGLCFLAWDIWSLIAFRVLTMVLAGASGPSAMAILFHAYPPEHRTQAISWWSMSGPGSAALGLILGGPLVDLLGWRSVFFVQAGAGVIALLLAVRFVPETKQLPAAFDHMGNIILLISLSCLLFVVGTLPEPGVTHGVRMLFLVMGVAGLVIFFRHERRVAEPIVPPDLFGLRNFNASVAANFLLQLAYTGALIATPLVLVGYFNYSISAASLLMLLRTASLTFASPFAGRISARWGEKFCVQLGTSLQTAGLLLVGVGILQANLAIVSVGLLLQGVGHGFALPALTALISLSVSSRMFGAASGVSRLIGQVGSSFGLSLFGVLLAFPDDVVGMPMIFLVGALFTVAALLPGLILAKPVLQAKPVG